MATYEATIESPRPPDEVFEYMAAFSNAAQWDPGVAEAEPLVQGPPQLGSCYRLGVRMAGRLVHLDYRVVEIDRPTRVVVQAKERWLRSTDTMTVEPAGSGSVLRYEAVLELRGLLRPLGALLQARFDQIGDRAAAGLRAALA